MSIKKSFKLLLSTQDATFTGTRSNATYPLNLSGLGLTNEDLSKRYKMTFYLRTAFDTSFSITNVLYFATILLSNGSVQRKIYNTTQGVPTGILQIKTDSTNNYVRNNFYSVSGTIASNRVQLVSNTGLIAGQTITFYGTGSIYGGADFGGLVNGQQYIISNVLVSNQIQLAGVSNLTTTTGTMSASSSYNFQLPYLEALPNDNQPSYIENLIGVNSVNIQITTSAINNYLITSLHNAIVLYFEEI